MDGLWVRPQRPRAVYVLAHGAGAGMRHRFMDDVAQRLGQKRIATFRFDFPYMSEGRRRPDAPAKLQNTIVDAVDTVAHACPQLPIFVGGKSMGGRMSSHAAAAGGLSSVAGLVFLGFPLHAPGRDGTKRAEHLADVKLPMLFVQGTRDKLANLDLITAVCSGLGERATIHVVEGGDHSFNVLKRSGRTEDAVMGEIADVVESWMMKVVG